MTHFALTVRRTKGDDKAVSAQRTEADEAKRGERGLDWFTFSCANLQTGFGPFVAVYLTTEKWSQTDIGLVLLVGGLVGLVCQVPGGALVDRIQSKPLTAGIAVAAIGAAALCVASSTLFPVILFAWVLHAAASCVLSPAITTTSLALVGYAEVGRRLGRNATFASIGSALAAGGMGACGYFFSNKAVFFVTAALAVPSIAALWPMRRIGTARSDAAGRAVPARGGAQGRGVLLNRPLLILAVATALFYLANAAMLPLVGSVLTMRSAHSPTIFIAACIIVPQAIVAVLSPVAGTRGQDWGRRPLLIVGFATLPLRGLLLGFVHDPVMFVVVQALDGVSAAVLGVTIALVAADATRGTRHFAAAQGVIGTAMGLGAAFSSTLAGFITDHYGSSSAFFGLTAVAVVAFALVLVVMPETRDPSAESDAPGEKESRQGISAQK